MVDLSLLYKLSGSILELSSSIWERALEIVKQPTINTGMLWVLFPLLITLFVMQLYFGRYKREELGWNSALGNSIVLLFVGANLFSYIFRNELFWFNNKETIPLLKTAIASIVVLESIVLIITNFFHVIPKKMAFNISSVLFLNFVATISVILIYSGIAIDYMTLLAAFAIFMLLSLFFETIKIIIPEHVKKELKEIKEDIKKEKVELKEVEVEKKEKEKEEIKKEKDEIQKKEEEIQKIKGKIKKEKKKEKLEEEK